MMATTDGKRVWNYEDNNVPLFQVEVCEFREIILLWDIISRYLRLQRFFQLYSYTLGYMNNRTWIKKKQDQHQFISSESCDLLVTMMLKEEMCTVGLSDWAWLGAWLATWYFRKRMKLLN